ncbi:hypothetical protein SAMN05421690_100763 [Nitrosomonas sp. Nm51]|uniref:hypothetical protein n=1 Tax=Nitrosomonas sp. Nm51 TaxID=133720 RepID=UPI0008C0AD72|nr:hypothetical protein [Nitrosomonas sp. Nm51]SER07157.1 hypothetical protein SAMN05421690_100763 [Nitrosomonas sp. Nm51]
MNILTFIQSEYVSLIAGGLGGVTTAWITQKVLNKRGVFTYFVNHNRMGLTVEDPTFGKLTALWNGTEIPNLYLSNIDLINESLIDYENVVVKAYTSDTKLLSEQTQIVDSPYSLEWTDKYRQQLYVADGAQPAENQWALYNGQREYLVPVMNRG